MASDWTLMQSFLRVAEAGSLSAAARRMGISQPTVGRQIAALEKQCGQRLFLRGARGLSLTPAGARLRDAAAAMDQAAEAALRALAAGDEQLSGSVRISATEGLGIHWLTGVLPGFAERQPRIDIELAIDNLAVNLARRDADIALRLFRPEQKRLKATRAAKLSLGLYASRHYVARAGLPQSADELPRHEFVGFDENMSQFGQAEWLSRLAGGGRMRLRANTLMAQHQAVREGLGIGVLSCFLADADRELVRLLPGAEASVEIWLVVHDDLKDVPRIRVTHDYLLERLRADVSRFAGRPR